MAPDMRGRGTLCEANGVTVRDEGHRRRVPGALGRRGPWALGRALAALSLSVMAVVVTAGPGLGARSSGWTSFERSVSGKEVRSPLALQNGTQPGITDIVSGTAADGDVWTLYVNGPNQNLCLSVKLKGRNVSPGSCTTESLPVARQRPERVYRPIAFGESRTSAFVYGRLPEGTENVSVRLSTGRVLAARETIAGPTGPFYVVEMPEGAKPTTVLGSLGDGTSVSYAVEWPFRSSGGRTRGGLLVLTVLAVTLLCRRGLARRRSLPEPRVSATW